MTNTQLYFSIGLPTFTSLLTLTIVVLGWFLSRSDSTRLADKIDASNRDLNVKMDASNRELNVKMDASNRELNNKIDSLIRDLNGKFDASSRDLHIKMEASSRDLNGRIDGLRIETVALRNQIHQDMVMLHERIVKVEAKQANG